MLEYSHQREWHDCKAEVYQFVESLEKKNYFLYKFPSLILPKTDVTV